MSGLNKTRGLCIEEGELYIVDHGDGKIYMEYQYLGSETVIRTFAELEGAYNIFCANGAYEVALGIFLIVFG